MSEYIISIDQSTAGTKALLFDYAGGLVGRVDAPHRQFVDNHGWVEHDPMEIYAKTLEAVRAVVDKTDVDKSSIVGVGISNQRETALVWDSGTGLPVHNAVVWQCARGEAICEDLRSRGHAPRIQEITGLPLSPYFSAAKLVWVLRNADVGDRKLCCGTMDSWLLYKLTGQFKTDYSNASRTQLFDLRALNWSEEICALFGIELSMLAEPCFSDTDFGSTDFSGFLERKVPIRAVFGDSHGALFGQGCHSPGMVKATYGTGSSVMMNIGSSPVFTPDGIVTSVGWGMNGAVSYVLEGNINYSGAVMTWMSDELGLIPSPKLAAQLAAQASEEDETYLVPAFSGLGAPYWDSKARAVLCGMSRTTGKAEIIRAAEECIAYQIADIVAAMGDVSGLSGEALRVDGGATRDEFLMQFQSDILDLPVDVSDREELSGTGAAYAAGIALGLYNDSVFNSIGRKRFLPAMNAARRVKKLDGWKNALLMATSEKRHGTGSQSGR